MIWTLLHPLMEPDSLGLIPSFLSEDNPQSARQQIGDAYISGWQPFEGFTMDPSTKEICYPGDPPMAPLARTWLRDELILFYESAWLAIVQPDGSFEIARLD